VSQDQITAFYHDQFVENQVNDFMALSGFSETPTLDYIVDMGDSCSFFAKALQNHIHKKVRVLDSDSQSIDFCKQEGIEATYGDALKPTIVGDEAIVCFNLILHHLVGRSDHETYKMQGHALSVWHSTVHAIFVNE